MNRYHVTAPDPQFEGESCGVVFKDGAASVSDETKEGRAAVEYFRRRGYAVSLGAEAEQPEPVGTFPEGAFDPAVHDAAEVIAYLDALGDDEEAVAEFARVIEVERNSKARKTVLALAEEA